MVLIKHLPPDGAFGHAIDPAGALWRAGDYILADLIDALKGGGKPYPRPTEIFKIVERRKALERQADRLQQQRGETRG